MLNRFALFERCAKAKIRVSSADLQGRPIMLGQDAQYANMSVSSINGVAEQTCKKLDKLGLFTFYDLIFNLPFRYEDRTYIQALKQPRSIEDPCNVLLTITSEPVERRKTVEFSACDHEGTKCKIIFFHAAPFIIENLKIGTTVLAWGKIKISVFNGYTNRSIVHPQIDFINEGMISLPLKLSPVYHLTAGLKQTRLRKITEQVLQHLANHPLQEILPVSLNPFRLTLSEALLDVHNPLPKADHSEVLLPNLNSFKRICFEELVAYMLCIMSLRAQQKSKNATPIELKEETHQKLLSTLPFTPTAAQDRVFHEIMQDCGTDNAMNRLVHGDVGSGKTLVAAMVMLQVAANGYQAALLAPTELLAQQHQQKLGQFFAPLGIEVALITGSMKKKERDTVFAQAESGSVKIFVGTHALFQKNIHYQHLALVIIDEQHRFGVDQREALLNKAPPELSAHELLMTATPIPRSLQQALFADTAVSTIDMLPQGRSPIITAVLSQSRDREVIERLRYFCSQGNQAYWVCPLIEENEVLDATSAKERYQTLNALLPELRIGLLHAQLKEKEKNDTMRQFMSGELNILVATTIIEVGVDVPNATVMVIESADRLGLAQLHQLRGRVGRGNKQSFCLLLHRDPPDPNIATPVEMERFDRAMARMQIMRTSTNGFEIANEDLRMRGAGEFFGTNQTGKENFRFADFNRDCFMLPQAKDAAKKLFGIDQATTKKLIWRWFPAVLDEIQHHHLDSLAQESTSVSANTSDSADTNDSSTSAGTEDSTNAAGSASTNAPN